jgi:putative (di)nucleoside polyphosphate hydrolase
MQLICSHYKMKHKDLPLRTGVGIVVLNSKNKVFVGKRKDNPFDKWQMPQGGVDTNEPLLIAMKRELEEETSIKSIKVLKKFNQWLEYDLPEDLIGKIWNGQYRGQKQKWFIVRFLGEENEININTKHPEFIEWKWIDMNFLPDLIVNFKKHIYKNILVELKKYIN